MIAAAVSIPSDDHDDTLAGLVERLEERDAESLPDLTVPLSQMTMTPADTLVVPGVGGTLAMTDWARGQLARQVGLRGIASSRTPRPAT